MDDEFKLCWKNFQDNIASGFQNLYDRGDLVDVTLACDGKLLHAHKIVLAICSPYFQEIFITNPCKHPIIILKDVTFNIMCELLEFMYQGVVNVKHTELQTFMKIGQLLQIKGLATNTSTSAASSSSEKSVNQTHNNDEVGGALGGDVVTSGSNAKVRTGEHEGGSTEHCSTSKTNPDGNTSTVRSHTPTPSPSPMSFAGSTLNQTNVKSSPESSSAPLHHTYNAGVGHKRHSDFGSDALSIYARKQFRRSAAATEHNSDHNDGADGNSSMDQVNPEDFFLSNIPHISMIESRYDLSSVKRESEHHGAASSSAAALRNSFGPAFSFDYNMYKSNSSSNSNTGVPVGPGSGVGVMGGAEYPNDLHMPNDYSKNFGNHMDIPANSSNSNSGGGGGGGVGGGGGSNVVMLSSTSLLHGNCVFNRNNTVATQQGMKTYWLCKSYRISMCRARCITHQGRVISATGVHNHPPHMRAGVNNNNSVPPPAVSSNLTISAVTGAAAIGGSGSYIVDSPSIGSQGNVGGGSGGGAVGSGPNATTQSLAIMQNTGLGVGNSGSNMRLPSTSSTSNMFQHNMHAGMHSHLHSGQTQHPHAHPHPHSHPHPHLHSHSHGHMHQESPTQTSPQIPVPTSQTSTVLGAHHLPNLLVQHHPGGNSASNSVIHHMMHGSTNLMHLPSNMAPSMGAQHSPQLTDPVHNSLEVVPIIHSSPAHLQSPSNRSNPPHHGIGSPRLKSPHQSQLSDEMTGAGSTGDVDAATVQIGEQHMTQLHNATLSPNDDLHSNGVGDTINTGALNVTQHSNGSNSEHHQQQQQQQQQQQSHHQARVIDSITISPGSGHNFKIEDM